MDHISKLYFEERKDFHHLSQSQESLCSSESSIGSEGLGPLPASTLADLCRAANSLLPIQKTFPSSLSDLATHSLSQSTSSSETSSFSRSQSPSKLSDNKCHICSYITNRRSNLLRHLETMHKNQQNHVRVLTFPAYINLIHKHFSFFYFIQSLECCDTMFASKSELREHKRQSHVNGYGCLVCSRTFCR